ncbi:MAG: ComEC/Rec2 family competence protein [Bauldia sp.]|nr:ComEC/Rec2 family competence protein [Bauldia sp.]
MAEQGLDDGVGERLAGWPRRAVAFAGILERLRVIFEREMAFGRGALWVPVLFGAGVLAYFALAREPAVAALIVVVLGLVGVAIAGRRRIGVLRLALALAAVAAGTLTMKLRTELVEAPIIARDVSGILTGWVEDVERFSPSRHRLVVRVVSMERLDPDETPKRVRITVRGAFDVHVGDGISGLVALRSPAAPVMPGGYDFGRELFYEGIGGSGFSYGPPDLVDLGPAPSGIAWKIPLERLRETIRARIEAAIPGDNGQIAVAMIVGEQGGISDETQEIFRTSGLGHILSISGLHMALIAGSAFWLIRALLALSMTLALTRPIKKWAAAGALAVATFYLAISGGEVATQRSYTDLGSRCRNGICWLLVPTKPSLLAKPRAI